jgi:hypothetical protein
MTLTPRGTTMGMVPAITGRRTLPTVVWISESGAVAVAVIVTMITFTITTFITVDFIMVVGTVEADMAAAAMVEVGTSRRWN